MTATLGDSDKKFCSSSSTSTTRIKLLTLNAWGRAGHPHHDPSIAYCSAGRNEICLFSDDPSTTIFDQYVDRILPDEKTLKARLKLRIKPNRVCILSHVLELYSEIKSMRVVMDHENGGPAIFLKDEPSGFLGFVDPCSNADPYPDTVWQHFENHLRTMLDDMNSRQEVFMIHTWKDKDGWFRSGHSSWAAHFWLQLVDVVSR